MIPMLDIVRMHAPLHNALRAAFDEVLVSGQFINGPFVAAFETDLAHHVNASHAIAVSSGTDALLVGLMALGVAPGDEVITSPYTFFATAGAIARLGATPVFVDIHPETFQLDETKIEAAITPLTRGIIPVHLFGGCATMGTILELARARNLWVLEDAAQSLGALQDGAFAGTIGDAGIYSFFPAKNLGALGDGGAVVTDNDELAGRIRLLRSHGAAKKYHHEALGGNFRMDALQAALLRVKLPHLTGWEAGRAAVAKRYTLAFAQTRTVQTVPTPAGDCPVFNQYVITVKNRDEVAAALREQGIASAVYYPQPLHLAPVFASLQRGVGSFPHAERAAATSLAIPVDPFLDLACQQRIIDCVIRTATSCAEKSPLQ